MTGRRPSRQQTAERRASALRMRAKGAPYTEVAAALDYASPSAASRDVHRALRQTVREAGRELLDLEAERTERLLERAFDLAASDDMRGVRAVEAAVKVLERRARMLGLDNAGNGPNPADGAGIIGRFFAELQATVPPDDPHDN